MENDRLDLWARVVTQIAAMQRAAIPAVAPLLALGCADQRLDALAAQAGALPTNPHIRAALPDDDYRALCALIPRLQKRCVQLAEYNLPRPSSTAISTPATSPGGAIGSLSSIGVTPALLTLSSSSSRCWMRGICRATRPMQRRICATAISRSGATSARPRTSEKRSVLPNRSPRALHHRLCALFPRS
jgi:hypothetical protein